MRKNATKASAPNLAETQALLKSLITDPRGVAAAMQAQGISELPIKSGGSLDPIARANIYNQMYYLRLLETLRNDFDCIEYFVGTTAFEQLAADYLEAHPPSHYSLRYVGRHMMTFLERYQPLQQYGFLTELATFEWAIISSFDAPEHSTLTMEHVQQLPPETWAELSLQLSPSVQILSCHWPIDTIRETWKTQATKEDGSTEFISSNASLTSGKPELPAQTRTHAMDICTLITWRPELDVQYRRLTTNEASLLPQLQHGISFGTLCEQCGTPEQAAGLLKRWIEDGLLTLTTPS